MKPIATLLPDHGPRLSRRDLITCEHLLAQDVASFLPYASYSLAFPKSLDQGEALEALHRGETVYLPKERRVLLPLVAQGALLGVFVAKGATLKAPSTLPPYLSRLAAASMEKLLLFKRSITDPASGLSTRDHFMEGLAQEVEQVRESILPGPEGFADAPAHGYTAGFGVLLLTLDNLPDLECRFGCAFSAGVLARAAEIAGAAAPEGGLGARLGENQMALLLPGAGPGRCAEHAGRLVGELREELFEVPVLREGARLTVTAGFANYPHDMGGRHLEQPAPEQAAVLLAKAARAAAVAREHGAGQCLGFGSIIREGGRVLRTLPMHRLSVSLGQGVGARDGQRFRALAPEPGKNGYVAEITLLDAGEDASLAEVTHLASPTRPVAPGDRLELIDEEAIAAAAAAAAPRAGAAGPLSSREFLEHFIQARERCSGFALVLAALPLDHAESLPGDETEALVGQAARAMAQAFGPDAAIGRFAIGSLLAFVPGLGRKRAAELAGEIIPGLPAVNGRPPAVGVAFHPFLSFAKADALENARKALEYARLLPAPHLGVLDSVALNIHADALYSQGQTYDAIEEYKLSLLADRGNALARNSLGVCLARTGDYAGAKRQFKAVLEKRPRDLMARYNYGYACQRLNQPREAGEAFRACLKLDPVHLYSHIRLGQLAQRARRFRDARRWLAKAADLPGGAELTRRYLARLALAQGKPEEARDLLHQALIHNPKDSLSLHLMAELYLDHGEDPEIAEALARQSAALKPDAPAFWRTQARALKVQSKTEEALAALARAEG